jgi:hypothetical protein
MHIPHPIHSFSSIKLIVDAGETSIHIFADLFTGQPFMHSCLHYYGLHKFGLMIILAE